MEIVTEWRLLLSCPFIDDLDTLFPQVCESTGVVVTPYMEYPQLLGVLLRLLGEASDGPGKRGVLRLLGVLGALDPHMHKSNQANLKVRSFIASVCLAALWCFVTQLGAFRQASIGSARPRHHGGRLRVSSSARHAAVLVWLQGTLQANGCARSCASCLWVTSACSASNQRELEDGCFTSVLTEISLC